MWQKKGEFLAPTRALGMLFCLFFCACQICLEFSSFIQQVILSEPLITSSCFKIVWPFKECYDLKFSVMCTDDKGVFNCDLSQELRTASEAVLSRIVKIDRIPNIFGTWKWTEYRILNIFGFWKMNEYEYRIVVYGPNYSNNLNSLQIV